MKLKDNAPDVLKKGNAFATQAVLAYGVGMEISLSSTTASKISDYMSEANKYGGSVSVFGFNIGLGGDVSSSNTSTTNFDQVKSASSGTTINIPPTNNGYPTLLAIIGQKLPSPPSA